MRPLLSKVLSTAAVAALLAGTAGCARREAAAQDGADGAASATVRSGTAPVGGRTTIQTVAVPDDREVLVVAGDTRERRPIVYLHGMCADPRDDLEAWGAVARTRGTIVALAGDVPCPDKPGRAKWTTDPAAIDARIEAALAAVSGALPVELDVKEPTLIGESMGAERAQMLAAKFGDRYKRLVLVGSPKTPSPHRLREVSAVANLAGEHEPQAKMKQGTRALDGAGKATRFWELPGATHGNYGPEGERIMDEALGFVVDR